MQLCPLQMAVFLQGSFRSHMQLQLSRTAQRRPDDTMSIKTIQSCCCSLRSSRRLRCCTYRLLLGNKSSCSVASVCALWLILDMVTWSCQCFMNVTTGLTLSCIKRCTVFHFMFISDKNGFGRNSKFSFLTKIKEIPRMTFGVSLKYVFCLCTGKFIFPS